MALKKQKRKQKASEQSSDPKLGSGEEEPKVRKKRKGNRVKAESEVAQDNDPEPDGDDKEDQAPAEEEDDGGALAALMRLRALLAPTAAAAATPGPTAEPAEAEDAADGKKRKKDASKQLESQGPDWTSRYCVVDAAGEPTPLSQLAQPLHPAVQGALQKAGYDPLFPIQAAVIPLLAQSAKAALDHDSPYCCDVCVSAPTGQGKTLAYVAPIVQALLDRLAPCPRAVVLLPTRDLALQVHRVFENLRLGLLGSGVVQLRTQCLVGAKSLVEEQRALSDSPPDVVVCTPGRLAEHFLGRDATLDLGALRWFVVDEADRLLTQTYHRWLDVLDRVCTQRPEIGVPGPRPQKLLLSATMTWDPRKLAALKLLRPLYFFSSRSGQHATPAQLRQHYVRCRAAAKPLAVLHLLRKVLGTAGSSDDAAGGRVVIFCQSVNTAHRLSRLLQICGAMPAVAKQVRQALSEGEEGEEEGETEDEELEEAAADGDASDALKAPGAIAEFSSNLSQSERNTLLKRFRSARVKCLVCSDVVARGIDIPEVTAVINYAAPSHLQTYIHRVGRTARAGRVGHTFTFVRKAEMGRFEEMLRQSADCWERISKYPLPDEARDTRQRWWPRALKLLQRCLEMEKRGQLSTNKPVDLSDLGVGSAPGSSASAVEATSSFPAAKPSRDPSAPKAATAGAAKAVAPKAGSLLDFARMLQRSGSRAASGSGDHPV